MCTKEHSKKIITDGGITMREKTVGQRLRELRGLRSKKEVADAVGVSLSSYVKYERDERHPNDATKVRLAKYFGKSVASIFFS